MNSYEEKKQARADRARELAAKARQESNSAFQKAQKIGEHIPLGQPILVGHHSEGRHRRDIGRIDSAMRQSVEADRKAEYYENKAESIENSNVISSDDPEAWRKLKDKLLELESMQRKMIQANKIVRSKKLSEWQKVGALVELGFTDTTAHSLLQPDFAGRIGFPAYRLTNNNQNIARVKDRIRQIEARAKQQTKEQEIKGVRIVDNVEANRIQAFFPGKPIEMVRAMLKKAGYRWSPTNGCWQAYRNRWAMDQLKEICEKLY